MIRPCTESDIHEMLEIINDAATAYEGRIPPDRYHTPYMSKDELELEISDGVEFHGAEISGRLLAVMGIQDRGEVTLIRHAYTRTNEQGRGYGGALLEHLTARSSKPVLVGTWKAATWAIAFYEKQGFVLTDGAETRRLLRRYWRIPTRQIETSVVLTMAM